jgi:hypothetical protein
MRITKKPITRGKRKNVAPQSPRFLPPAKMQGEGTMKTPKKEKTKKPKTASGQSGKGFGKTKSGGINFARGGGRGSRTSSSCRS